MQRDRHILNVCMLATLVVLFVASCAPVPTPTPLPSPSPVPTVTATRTAVPTNTAVPSPTATTRPSATPTGAAKASPTTSAAIQPAVNAAMLKDTCLACHGPIEKLVKATPSFTTKDGEKVNPHITVDFFAKKPHASSEGVMECGKCHTPHPIPVTSVKDLPKANVDFCFSCHHKENFTPCSECH